MPLFQPSIYRFEQVAPAATWYITHNLGNNGSLGIPIVDAYVDIDGVLTKIIPVNTEMTDQNSVVLTFSSLQSGFAMVIV